MACDHEVFMTRAAAEAKLATWIEWHKKTGQGGKSWKRLNVFRCGNHWHIGRANGPLHQKPAPTPKPPSVGDLRRRLERINRKTDRALLHRARLLAAVADNNRMLAEAEAERRRIDTSRLLDLQDSIAVAQRMAAQARLTQSK